MSKAKSINRSKNREAGFSRRTLSRLTYDPSKVEGRLWGYARVSTEDQKLDLQMDALKRAGVEPDRIYVEKVSGASHKRPELAKALKACREGDTLVVWRLDRLGRSLLDLLKRMHDLRDRKVAFKSLTEAIDTGTPSGMLILHMLGAIAEFERQLTRERTKAGVAAHRERGGRHGAPLKLDLQKVETLLRQGVTVKDVARRLKIKHASNIYHHFTAKDVQRLAKLGPLKSKQKPAQQRQSR